MDQLPTELLHQIFIQLELSERLECMLVCQYWYHILHTRSLLYEVTITSRKRFDMFIDMVNRLYTRPPQVEILTLYDCLENCDKRHLVRIFPNLRQLSMFEHNSRKIHTSFFHSKFELKPSTCRIEELIDYGECEVARQLASSALCTHLKDLTIYAHGDDATCQQIVRDLKNMPVLTCLLLKLPKIRIDDVETLDKNLPSIKKLDLRVNKPIASQVPTNVETAVSLQDLSIHFEEHADIETHRQWCQYMSKKYTCLTNLNISLEEKTQANQDELYQSGLLSLLNSNGPHLKKLTLPFLPSNVNIFEILDQANCQLKKFHILLSHSEQTLLSVLCWSNQAKSIESLDLSPKVRFAQNPLLKRMEALESVSVSFIVETRKDTIIDLNKHLQTFPASLKTIKINCSPSGLVDTEFADLVNRNELGPETDTFNTVSHPHLSHVVLCVTRPTETTLLIPHSRLDCLSVLSRIFACSYYALIEVLDDNKSALFEVNSGQAPLRVPHKISDWPLLVVKAKSVKRVVIQARLVHL